jgi:hypothetical protein
MTDFPKPTAHLADFVSMPKPVQAVFYDGTNFAAVKKICHPYVELAPVTQYQGPGGDLKDAPRLWVGTLNGALCVAPRTWLVLTDKEAYPITEEVFEARYRPVDA